MGVFPTMGIIHGTAIASLLRSQSALLAKIPLGRNGTTRLIPAM